MSPFHGSDFYCYSPLELQHLLRDFEFVTFESPLWVFTVVGLAAIEVLKRLHLGFAERAVKRLCGALDGLFPRDQKRPDSFAAAYRIVVCKGNGVRHWPYRPYPCIRDPALREVLAAHAFQDVRMFTGE